MVTVIGGLSPQKQRRLLSRCPQIIVATPGRLWELISLGYEYLSHLNRLDFLVLDEADRMVETGHFKELKSILALINNNEDPNGPPPSRRQTFIFSATLSIPSQGRQQANPKKKATPNRPSSADALAKVRKLVRFHRPKEVVDLSTEKLVAHGLEETAIHCLSEEKDYYLYYLLFRHPGRTLVFVNSIACIRRLLPILTLLRVPAWGLHASMQQRQRLRNLERFKQMKNCVLIATDVAARGLDIPQIDHVLHYQLPRTTELYVHRSGRTARASAEGVSVMLVGPEDLPTYKKITTILRKGVELPNFDVDRTYLPAIAKRLNVARKVDKQIHHIRKHKSQKDWFIHQARAMDIEIDDDLLSSDDEAKTEERTRLEKEAAAAKAQLDALLDQPLVPRGGFTTFFARSLQADPSTSNTSTSQKKKGRRRRGR